VASEAIFGFAGVILGAATTSILTIYRDRLTVRQQNLVRDQQYERERKSARDAFQRESILALQAAVSDLIRAVYGELDRLLIEFRKTGTWFARQWETPTAAGWSESVLKLESSRARVFDADLRLLADELRTVAGRSVWADSFDTAKQLSQRLEPLQSQFNVCVTAILPSLY